MTYRGEHLRPVIGPGESALRYESVTDLSPDSEPLPRRQPQQNQQSQPGELPRRKPAASPGDPAAGLPRRTTHVRRVGRHRSPHRISVAPDAPVLLIASPGAPAGASRQLAEHIAESAAVSCPGVDIQIVFLARDDPRLPAGLSARPANGAQPSLQAVIVPLLAGPHPVIDAAINAAISRTPAPVMLAAHLGPHPLLAAALHDRLSEAGLARVSRARGLNIAAGASGVLLIADRGPQAISDAGVTAVLLAARLTVPVVPASIGDADSIGTALDRLREAGASHLAIAPCVIGPETDPAAFEQLSAVLRAPCAAPLGSHPAIAQLVAIRYGEALARISIPSH